MELLAMTMRAEGMLSCRSLSFKGPDGAMITSCINNLYNVLKHIETAFETAFETRFLFGDEFSPSLVWSTGASFRLVPVTLEGLANVYSKAGD